MIKVFAQSRQQRGFKLMRDFLDSHKLPYKIIPLSKMKREDLIAILAASEGVSDILIPQGKYSISNKTLRHMSMDELIYYILEFPLVLKSPLILDENKLFIGYNEQKLDKFLFETAK